MHKQTWGQQVVYLSTQEKKRQLEEERQKKKEKEVELARQRIIDQVGSPLSKVLLLDEANRPGKAANALHPCQACCYSLSPPCMLK